MQFLRNNWKIVLAAFFVVLIMAGIRGYQMYELKKMEKEGLLIVRKNHFILLQI